MLASQSHYDDGAKHRNRRVEIAGAESRIVSYIDAVASSIEVGEPNSLAAGALHGGTMVESLIVSDDRRMFPRDWIAVSRDSCLPRL